MSTESLCLEDLDDVFEKLWLSKWLFMHNSSSEMGYDANLKK